MLFSDVQRRTWRSPPGPWTGPEAIRSGPIKASGESFLPSPPRECWWREILCTDFEMKLKKGFGSLYASRREPNRMEVLNRKREESNEWDVEVSVSLRNSSRPRNSRRELRPEGERAVHRRTHVYVCFCRRECAYGEVDAYVNIIIYVPFSSSRQFFSVFLIFFYAFFPSVFFQLLFVCV